MPDSDEPAVVPLEVSERDKDLMARTLYGEANWKNPRAQAAVAQVIVNRALADGYPGTVGDVVLQHGQFEPWSNRRGELLSLPMDSAAYRQSLQTVNDVLAGNVPDMTGGATHFFSPKAQAALGRTAPAWARDPLAQEGGHVFYAPNGRVDRTAIGMPPGTGPAAWATLDQAGVAPRATGPETRSMPKEAKATETRQAEMDDDELLSLYGAGPAPKPPAAGKAVPATAAPAQASGRLSDDDLLGLYTAAPANPKAAPSDRSPQPAVAATPLPSPDGIVDGNTGALVVGGKPFTDNTSGLWAGFQNLANGALLGAGVPIASAAAALKEKALHGGDFSNLYAQARSAYGGAQERYRDEHPVAALATELAGSIPTTLAATAAGGAALAVPGNALLRAAQGSELAAPLAAAGRFVTGQGGAGQGALALAERIASRGTAGAAAGAFGGAGNTGLTGGDVRDNALMGAAAGLTVGAGLTAAGAAAGGVANRLTGALTPEAAALARRAQDLGIPIRAGQITDSSAVRFLDSTLGKTPGMGYGAANRAQQVAVNRAVAQTIGEDADRLTPAVMQQARTRLGQSFDRVAQGTFVQLDNPLIGDFTNIMREAQSVLTPAEVTPLQNLVRDGILAKFARLGDIGGEEYQALTRRGTPLDRLTQSNNPNVRHYAGQVREALDGALERSAPPELVQELRQARGQWRAMRTIEDLAAKSPTGDISPAGLMQAVQRGYGNRVAYTGGGDLGDLARIGQRFLKEPPSSGTAERIAAQDRLGQLAKLGQLAGGAAGAAMGITHFAPQIAAAAPAIGPALGSAAAGFAGGRIASQILRSDALANRLIDRALGTGQAGPVNRLLGAAAGAAPETAAPLYVRARPGAPAANDDSPANALEEFMRNRPQRAGVSVR
jgi:hypothetical protein